MSFLENMSVCLGRKKLDPIKVYAFGVSQPSRSVLLLCAESGIDFEFKAVDISKGEQKKPEFLAINPSGMVPAITDGDLNLSEGSAILTYIAQSRGLTSFLPEDPKIQAKINFWLSWHQENSRLSTKALVRPKKFGGAKDPAGEEQFTKAVAFIEKRLSEGGPFLAGTTKPTIADLMIIPELDQLTPECFGLFDYTPYPKVLEYMDNVKKALPVSYASNFAFPCTVAKSLSG
eukprot:TRINITY_DN22420_c0_g1_i1.p1 TRINITY_DN22420_c0_g1~~TRINITY_DN22420_c0_g1_i1.p1  ORF type:complete len:232 (-),score=51.12 TRINITY_DN22420_c0_g1_i1:451-1146(-)